MDTRETVVYSIYEWLHTISTDMPEELFNVLLPHIAIMLIGFERAIGINGIVDALLSPPRGQRGGVTDAELAAARQTAENEGATQANKNRYRNLELQHATERQITSIVRNRPRQLEDAPPLPRVPTLINDLVQFQQRIEELRLAKAQLDREIGDVREGLGELNGIVNNSNIIERYRTNAETVEATRLHDRLRRIREEIAKTKRLLENPSDDSLRRLVAASVLSAGCTALLFGGGAAAAALATGTALMGATTVGLAATAGLTTAAVIADNPGLVNEAVHHAYVGLTGVLSALGQGMYATDQEVYELPNNSEPPDFNTPLVQAAAAAARPYMPGINLSSEPSGYNENGVPIYNYTNQGHFQSGMPRFNPDALVLPDEDVHPIRALITTPLQTAVITVFIGGTYVIYSMFENRYILELRAKETSLRHEEETDQVAINRLIDVARQRHREARDMALAREESLQARIDAQDRIITNAYAKFVGERQRRIDAYEVLMSRWHQGQQAARIAREAAAVQMEFARSMMALAAGRPGAAPLLGNLAAEPPLLGNLPAAGPRSLGNRAPAEEELNDQVEGGRRRRKTRARRRPARKSRRLGRRT